MGRIALLQAGEDDQETEEEEPRETTYMK
jgi:hypothetical protein